MFHFFRLPKWILFHDFSPDVPIVFLLKCHLPFLPRVPPIVPGLIKLVGISRTYCSPPPALMEDK